MRFTVTPLGGAKRSMGKVVGDIVKYLIPRKAVAQGAAPQEAQPAGSGAGPAQYYADRGDEPGRWRGQGAARLGVDGHVDGEDLARVLSGRHPRTGDRLITAQGSAGRRPGLGVGSKTRWSESGEAIYDESDAGAALAVDEDETGALLDAGTQLAAARWFSWISSSGAWKGHSGTGTLDSGTIGPGSGTTSALPGGSVLVPILDEDGNRWVAESELVRCEAVRAEGVDPATVSAEGDDDHLFAMAEAARIAGVTPRYLRSLAKRYEDNQAVIDELLVEGRHPRQAYLIASRGTGNRWLVRRADLVAFLQRRELPAVRVAYDITATTEKSLSVLALLAEPETGEQVLDAIQDANDWALDWLEQHAAIARVEGKVVQADGWTVASFRHLTSRALDPFAHHHNVVPNTVAVGEDDRRALDARGLYRHAKGAGALATAEARSRLSTTVRPQWRPGRKGGWEIAGISDDVLDEFSQRRNEVDDALQELEEAIGRGARPDEVEQIVLRTRSAKQHASVDELRSQWRQRAEAIGFDAADLAACLNRPAPAEPPEPEFLFARLAAPDGICRNLSVFNLGDALAALCDLPIPQSDGTDPQPLIVPAQRLEELAAAFLNSPNVVQLSEGDDARYTTLEILSVQERIIERYEAGMQRYAGVVAPRLIDEALAMQPHLTDAQRELVEQFCSSGQQTQCALGYPGAGKTTSMAAARNAWMAAGWRVVGAAVKGEAARLLGEATGMPTETLAWWLAHDDPMSAPLDARTVLIVDEASTISDRDLDRLGWLCDQTGAVLRLIGDPGQHGAVEAGGMFRVLCEQYEEHTPELTETHRVRDPRDRAAADLLRRGQVDRALDQLNLAGHLHIVDDELDFYRQALARWWDARCAGLHHPMVDGRNVVRHRLNRLAHRLLQVAGEVGQDEIPASGGRAFAVGDRVIARRPARDLHPADLPDAYVRNGAVGTVVGLARGSDPAADSVSVDFDGIGVVTLPRTYFDASDVGGERVDVGLDHGYAVTSYAVQGSTSAVSTSRIDERSSRAELLVDITRGRSANHVYLTRADNPLDGEQLPRADHPAVDDAVAAKLQRSQGEITAWEIAHAKDDNDDPLERSHTGGLGL